MPPSLIKGDIAVDDRGQLSFVNAFSLDLVKRFYVVRNHTVGFVRAWHGHKVEEKYVLALEGTSLVCCVEVDDWENPSKDLPIDRFVLSANKPAVLHIPAGYANGFMTLSANSILMFFSTHSLEDSMNDDYRFSSRYWDPWFVEER